MNTFWLKIAVLAVIVVAVIVLIGVFYPSERPGPLPKPTVEPVDNPAKTFADQVEKDREKFSSPPQQVREQNQPEVNQTPAEPVRPAVKSVQLYFKPLSEIEKVEAERLLNVAVSGRSIGRLPQTGFRLMVDACRQIISRWPDSWYAYNAKQMLTDMPVRFREQYKITQEELDISKFEKQRPGTEPFSGTDTVEEESP